MIDRTAGGHTLYKPPCATPMREIPTPFTNLRPVVDQLLGKMFSGDELAAQVQLFRPELVRRLPTHTTPQDYSAALITVLEQDAGRDGICQLLRCFVTLPEQRRWRGQILRIIAQIGCLPEAPTVSCPYPGLQAFSERDNQRFFGRDAEIEALVDHGLAARWLWIDGASGVGKSSLVSAGLLPRLRRESGQWLIASLRPGHFPLENLARAVVRALPATQDDDIEGLRAQMLADPASLRRFIDDRVEPGGHFVLVVDQLEEALTFGDPDQVRQFDHAVAAALAGDVVHFQLITTIRSDQAGALLDGLGALGRQINQPWVKRYTVLPLDTEDLAEVIEDPLLATRVSFEPGLAERIRSDAKDMLASTSDGCLPLLALALRELWFACLGESQLTHVAYQRLGGIAGALTRSAEEALAKLQALDPAEPDGVQRLLLALTTVDRKSHWTRQTLLRKHALAALRGPRAEVVLAGLTGQVTGPMAGSMRLVVTSGEAEQARVDLIHEALLTQWPRLKGWLAEAEDEKRLSQQLLASAQLFRDFGELPSRSFRDRLLEAKPAAEDRELCQDFQAAMRAAVARERVELQQRRVKSRRIIAGLSLLVVVLAIQTYLAVKRRWELEGMLDERESMIGTVARERAAADAARAAADIARVEAEADKRIAEAAEAEAKRQREAMVVLLRSNADEVESLVRADAASAQGPRSLRAERVRALALSVQTAVEISQAGTSTREPMQLCSDKLARAEALDRSSGAAQGQATLAAVECYRNLARMANADPTLRQRVEQDGARVMRLLGEVVRRAPRANHALLLGHARDLALDATQLRQLEALVTSTRAPPRGRGHAQPSPASIQRRSPP